MKELKLKQGRVNKVRLASKPFMYPAHRIIPDASKEFGDWSKYMSAIEVRCSLFHGSCLPCSDNNRYWNKFLVAAIDRNTDEEGYYRLEPGVFKEIQRVYRKLESLDNDLTQYELSIHVARPAIKTSFEEHDGMNAPLDFVSEPMVDCSVNLGEMYLEPRLANFDWLDKLAEMCRPVPPESTKEALKAARDGMLFKDEHQTTRKWFDFSYADWI